MAQNSYDETPYPASAFPQTHPVKLATISRLFGLSPTPPENCRVLELGCADGSNLLPLAQNYPNSTFHGIDFSTVQIEQGKKHIAGAGLTNLTIAHQDIGEYTPGAEKFDYIIVHGIFSWVPPTIREKILNICRESLTDNGVAYISYNAFPGWHMRGMLRNMMLFHVRQFQDVGQKVAQARALLKFLAESVSTENNPFGQFLKTEVELAKNWTDSYLRHEWLEEENQPFYFHEFAAMAAQQGLQYLGETEFSGMLASNYPQSVQESLQRVGTNIIAMEQYMDFLRNRMFRQTLLVKKEASIKRNIDPALMTEFWFSTHLRPVSAEPNLAPGQKEEFKAPNGATISSDNQLVKGVLLALARAMPNVLSFADLVRELRVNTLGQTDAVIRDPEVNKKEEGFIAQQLLMFYSRGLIEVTSFPYPTSGSGGAKPSTTPLVRYQALNMRTVANIRSQSLTVDIFSRHLLSVLDGNKDRAAILEAMIEKVHNKALNVQHNGGTITDRDFLTKILEPRIDGVLRQMEKLGLLSPA